MKGYASIGTIYSFRSSSSDTSLIFAVIENDSNNNTSTLAVVEACPENGKKVKVDAKWLSEREPMGPVLTPEGEIVIENGREFVRPLPEKIRSRELAVKK